MAAIKSAASNSLFMARFPGRATSKCGVAAINLTLSDRLVQGPNRLVRSCREESHEIVDDAVGCFLLQIMAGREWLGIDKVACELAPYGGKFLGRRRPSGSP